MIDSRVACSHDASTCPQPIQSVVASGEHVVVGAGVPSWPSEEKLS